ncbi:H-NS family nucleoid-associated regulatory protein [Paraburkholderia kururiensis]|uniref:H-NS histone family protein n=1 Tax=Paraburkholderia kururiensis TaxID=984307 RepID=UPI000F889090|nr:H-NS histone family protein [Paraburkholderia kururiensis]
MTKTYRELLAERRELEERIALARDAERSQALATVRELMVEFLITPEELMVRRGAKKTGPQPPKYRDPVSGATWNGKGRAPLWIAGRDRAAFEI